MIITVFSGENLKLDGREAAMEWTRVAPVYPVADISKATEWYSQVFGFKHIVNPPGEPLPSYAVLYRDEVRLHLLRRDEAPHGLSAVPGRSSGSTRGWTTFRTRAESLGANVLQRPDARPWGHRDFMVADPDGNVVWVTTPIVTTAG